MFDGFGASGQKRAIASVSTFAVLTEVTWSRGTFADHVTPFVALVADRSLRAFLGLVTRR